MNKLIFSAILILTILSACNPKIDCPEKEIYMNIALANNTDYKINVTLFPKQEYLDGNDYYRGNDYFGGLKLKNLELETGTTHMWSFENTIYETKDTVLSPSELLNKVFDSIYLEVENEFNTKIRLLPDTSINYIENPFENDSIWTYRLINTDRPDNDCDNPSDTKSYRLYFEQSLISEN